MYCARNMNMVILPVKLIVFVCFLTWLDWNAVNRIIPANIN